MCETLQGMHNDGEFGVLHCPMYSGAEIGFRAHSFSCLNYEPL